MGIFQVFRSRQALPRKGDRMECRMQIQHTEIRPRVVH